MGGQVTEVTSQSQWTAEISKATAPVIVDFSAVWCGPCKAIAPHFEQWSQKYTGIRFLKVDVDQQQEIASENGVTAMPTFIIFLKGKKVEEVRGADVRSLVGLLDKYNGMGGAFSGQGRTLAGNESQEPPAAPAASACEASAPAPSQPPILPYLQQLLQQLLASLHHWLLQLLAWFRPDAGATSSAASQGGLQQDAAGTAEGFDASRPSTVVQIRLPTGSKLTGTFNPFQTVGDLRRFVTKQAPGLSSACTLTSSFPPTPLLDDGQSLEAAGVANSVVNVR